MQADKLLIAPIDGVVVAVDACAYLVDLGETYSVVRLEEGRRGYGVVACD